MTRGCARKTCSQGSVCRVAVAVTTYVEDSASALRDREALLAAVLEQLPLGAIVTEVQGGAPLTNARALAETAADATEPVVATEDGNGRLLNGPIADAPSPGQGAR